jgi:hypothetical protein
MNEPNEAPSESKSQPTESTPESETKSPSGMQNQPNKNEEEKSQQPENSLATQTNRQIVNETDLMADALLNQISENPQQLLQRQFYLDARRIDAKQPDKSW